MQRRQLLALVAGGAIPLTGMLSGCGFELRGAQRYPFNSILMTGVTRTPSLLQLEIQRALSETPGMQVLVNAAPAAHTQVRLDFLEEYRQKVAVGLSVAGQVREFELRLRVKFKFSAIDGRELIDTTELRLQRPITYNESSALAKETEEVQLYRDMQSDLAMQLLRRIAAVKLP
jgi:LPS-assembly lipoprotein